MKIVPSSSIDVENISCSMCQNWDLVKLLLIKLGYMYKYGNNVGLNVIKVEELDHKTICGSLFQLGNTKIGNRKVHYLCRNKPIYQYPL